MRSSGLGLNVSAVVDGERGAESRHRALDAGCLMDHVNIWSERRATDDAWTAELQST